MVHYFKLQLTHGQNSTMCSDRQIDVHNLMASYYYYARKLEDAKNELQLNSKLGEESGGNALFF